MARKKKIKAVSIIGRRWFNRGPGNTYHSVKAVVDGEVRASVDFAYGYGDRYRETGWTALEKAGAVPDRPRDERGITLSVWLWCQDQGIKLHYEVADVSRRKDL